MGRVCFTPNLQRHVAAPESAAPGATMREEDVPPEEMGKRAEAAMKEMMVGKSC